MKEFEISCVKEVSKICFSSTLKAYQTGRCDNSAIRELTYSLHGFMKELGILFGIEIDKWFHAASVCLQERETIYVYIFISLMTFLL